MQAILSQAKRPLLALALFAVVGAGYASAVEYFYNDQYRPVRYRGNQVRYYPTAATTVRYASSDACAPACPPPMPVVRTNACAPACAPVAPIVQPVVAPAPAPVRAPVSCNPCAAAQAPLPAVVEPITVPSVAPAIQPVMRTSAVASRPAAPAAGTVSVMPNGSKVVGIARTNLPGFYSDDYDYTVSSQRDLGTTYLVPTSSGLQESNRIPLSNPVDRYYGTHEEIGGKVIDLTDPANKAIEDANYREYVQDPANRINNQMRNSAKTSANLGY